MRQDGFPQEVVEALGCYVYRLIDPRSGETFYVGRGRGQRVFDHVRGSLGDGSQSAADPKLERINEIRGMGMDVAHVIHRHGMSDPTAREVEAALIDAYSGLENRVAGAGSRDHGTRHVSEIIQEYSAEEFVVGEPLILISIGRLWKERGQNGAVRGRWRLDMEKAMRRRLVLAHVRGVVRGAYRPEKWTRTTAQEVPDDPHLAGRIGFDGIEADAEVWERYVGKRVPSKYRKRGAQASCRYLDPQ